MDLGAGERGVAIEAAEVRSWMEVHHRSVVLPMDWIVLALQVVCMYALYSLLALLEIDFHIQNPHW